MPYEIEIHNTDLSMYIRAKTQEDLFKDALTGMMEIINHLPPEEGVRHRRMFHVEASDRTALLIEFLNEALSMSRMHREIYIDPTFLEFSDGSLSVELDGVRIEQFDRDIKAVTYHEAEITQTPEGGLGTRVVFDV